MELEILHALQKLRCDWLDSFMIFITSLSDHGEIWILIAAILMFFKKTRKIGLTMAISLVVMLAFGNGILKHTFKRKRPFTIDSNVVLAIKAPSSYSFPSGHTFSSFASAFSIFFYSKRWGIMALSLASMIAFSRMYLFVHYPTDIFGGILFGYITAKISFLFVQKQKVFK